jgi:hypothetical protein
MITIGAGAATGRRALVDLTLLAIPTGYFGNGVVGGWVDSRVAKRYGSGKFVSVVN